MKYEAASGCVTYPGFEPLNTLAYARQYQCSARTSITGMAQLTMLPREANNLVGRQLAQQLAHSVEDKLRGAYGSVAPYQLEQRYYNDDIKCYEATLYIMTAAELKDVVATEAKRLLERAAK